MKRAVISCAVAVLAAGGCKASVSTDTSADLPEYDQPMEATSGDQTEGLLGNGADPTGAQAAMVGARPDLMLGASNPTPNCACLAVVVGGANDEAFFWQAGAPIIGADQLVVAFSSQGIACPGAPADLPGATYWGHRLEGESVVVVIEPSREGRPMTMGAIIPRPGPGGAVYVAPQSARVPYGRSLVPGEKYCRVTTPSPAAAAP